MTESFVIALIRWWCLHGEGDFASQIAEEFTYDGGLEAIDREDFLLMRAGAGPLNDVRIVDIRCDGDACTVMFEATDTITDLRHRTCWMIAFDGDQIARVTACSGPVPKPEDRPHRGARRA